MMRISIAQWTPAATMADVRRLVPRLDRDGFHGFWLPMAFTIDSITALAAVGPATKRIELATGVVPILTRHPVIMAQQALTLQSAVGNRFTLGIGVSHRGMMHDSLGLPYDNLVLHMREYLLVLRAAMEGAVSFRGKIYNVEVEITTDDAQPAPVLVGALGPAMLTLAGELADGTITSMCGPRTIEDHIVPTIRAGAARSGRPAPRVAVNLPTILTNDRDKVREQLHSIVGFMDEMPAYKEIAAREGVTGVAGVGLIGDERELDMQFARLEACGATDFVAMPVPVDDTAIDRTVAFLASRL